MMGSVLKVATALSHRIILIGPLSGGVSPWAKWATTRMTKYPMETRAITLVYFRESSLRRKDSGMITTLEHQSISCTVGIAIATE